MTWVRKVLRPWGRLVAWFYFRDLRVVFHGEIPKDEPVIFVANHRNSLLDALVVIAFCTREPIALTRASVFQSPVARFFLKLVGCIPIHRFRDGFRKLRAGGHGEIGPKCQMHAEEAAYLVEGRIIVTE